MRAFFGNPRTRTGVALHPHSEGLLKRPGKIVAIAVIVSVTFNMSAAAQTASKPPISSAAWTRVMTLPAGSKVRLVMVLGGKVEGRLLLPTTGDTIRLGEIQHLDSSFQYKPQADGSATIARTQVASATAVGKDLAYRGAEAQQVASVAAALGPGAHVELKTSNGRHIRARIVTTDISECVVLIDGKNVRETIAYSAISEIKTAGMSGGKRARIGLGVFGAFIATVGLVAVATGNWGQ